MSDGGGFWFDFGTEITVETGLALDFGLCAWSNRPLIFDGLRDRVGHGVHQHHGQLDGATTAQQQRW